MTWHRPQQQHAASVLPLQLGKMVQGLPMEEVPPICWQEPALMTVQVLLAGLQQAPGPSPAQMLGLHGMPPVKVPFLRTQSQLVAVAQLPLKQQLPKTGVVGQKPGAHAAPGK
jgi:hypothetical protein